MMESVILVLVSCLIHSLTATGSDGTGYTMTLVASDLKVPEDNVAYCKAYRLPVTESSYIVEFEPHMNPDVYQHFNVYLCKEPGIKSSIPLDQLDWNCFDENYGNNPDLPNGTVCESRELTIFGNFDNNEDNIGLKLPQGYGFKAAGDTGYNYIVMAAHYPNASRVKDGHSGHSSLTVRIVPDDGKTKRVAFLNMESWGVLPPNSIASVNGSYVYDQSIPITPIAILAHTHNLGLDFQLWRRNDGADKRLVWEQDMLGHGKDGMYFRVLSHPMDPITDGQELTLRCTFNNTSPARFVLKQKDMCVLLMIVSVEGSELPPRLSIYTRQEEDAPLFPEPETAPGWRG